MSAAAGPRGRASMSRLSNPNTLLLGQECRQLAHQMVHLETLSRAATRRFDYVTAGDLNQQRREVQDRRSQLLRDLWRGLN